MTRFRNETTLRTNNTNNIDENTSSTSNDEGGGGEFEIVDNSREETNQFSRRLSSVVASNRHMNKRLRRTLTFLNLNRHRRGVGGGGGAHKSTTTRRLSLGSAPLSTITPSKTAVSSRLAKTNDILTAADSPMGIGLKSSLVVGGVKKKKTIKSSTKENLSAIKSQLKRYADEVSSIRVMKRKATNSMSNRACKRREIVKNLGMHSFLGWDSNLREYIQNPKYISEVNMYEFFFFFLFSYDFLEWESKLKSRKTEQEEEEKVIS